jgi:hypothetical protein
VDVNTDIPDGYATPHFFKHNGETSLFVGSVNGRLNYFNAISDSLATGGNFNLFSDNFLNLTVEGFSSFFVDDIDGDGFLNLFVGQDLGGITSLEVDPNSSIGIKEIETLEATIFPNPTKSMLNIQMKSPGESIEMKLYDLNGRLLLAHSFKGATQLELSNIEKGSYLLQLFSEYGNSVTKKIIKE